MAENAPNSIDIETERQEEKSKLASSITGSTKTSAVTPQKKLSELPSGDTTSL